MKASPTLIVPPPSALRLRIGEGDYDLSRRVLVVGVVNVTPDSFSDGGRWLEPDRAVAHALELIEEGADIVEVGAESTRPGSAGVSAEEEIERLRPVLEPLCRRARVPMAVDTSKPEVARMALDLGARVINDVTGLRLVGRDGLPVLACLAAAADASLVVMHMRGEPRDMQANPQYEDVVREVSETLTGAALAAERAGVERGRVVLDPGIGFGKTLAHNLELLRRIDALAALGYPVMIGVSRKSLFQKLLGLGAEERLEAAIAAAVAAVLRGARLVRTHDVRATARAIRVAEALL